MVYDSGEQGSWSSSPGVAGGSLWPLPWWLTLHRRSAVHRQRRVDLSRCRWAHFGKPRTVGPLLALFLSSRTLSLSKVSSSKSCEATVEESPTGERQPGALDIAWVAWPPYLFGKSLTLTLSLQICCNVVSKNDWAFVFSMKWIVNDFCLNLVVCKWMKIEVEVGSDELSVCSLYLKWTVNVNL
jgi:hypothetical protein